MASFRDVIYGLHGRGEMRRPASSMFAMPRVVRDLQGANWPPVKFVFLYVQEPQVDFMYK